MQNNYETPEGKMLTMADAARRIGVAEATLRSWMIKQDSQFGTYLRPTSRIGRMYFYDERAIASFLRGTTTSNIETR